MKSKFFRSVAPSDYYPGDFCKAKQQEILIHLSRLKSTEVDKDLAWLAEKYTT